MIWKGKFTLGTAETDINDIASPSVFLRYMQDAANRQMAEFGPSYESLLGEGKSFLISRVSLRIPSVLRAHDEFESSSHAVPSKGASFERYCRISRDGETVAESAAVWALVDVKSGSILRVRDVDSDYGAEPFPDGFSPERFRIPDGILTNVGEHVVGYADADHNGHMNNAKYPDILCSFVGSMKNRRVHKMDLRFVTEAPIGEKLSVFAGESDGFTYVRTVRQDGRVNAEARITFWELK
ncbi:MAG: thioesterase [Clostridia bacterium]|nr:thioesterase [Clostridia bacterium]